MSEIRAPKPTIPMRSGLSNMLYFKSEKIPWTDCEAVAKEVKKLLPKNPADNNKNILCNR